MCALLNIHFIYFFVTDKREDSTQEYEDPGSRAKRYNVQSRIKLKPTAEDDYAEYTCEARHEALPMDMPMRNTIQLSVLCEYLNIHQLVY